MKAVGVHVFGGGFTQGVRKLFDVECQLEKLFLGQETVEAMGIPYINEKEWPDIPDVDFVFGNPRCSGFSNLCAVCSSDGYGAWSKQTIDVHECCKWAVRQNTPIFAFESVQQIYTTGKPLLDFLCTEYFKDYKIAHVFVNARYHNNSQRRKRYFFVAYKTDHFNCAWPLYPEVSLRDVIGDMINDPAYPAQLGTKKVEYDQFAYSTIHPNVIDIIQHLQCGEDFNSMSRRDDSLLSEIMYIDWEYRTSDIPFGLFGPYRLSWKKACPTLHSGARALLHPDLDRGMTLRELSALMGWEVEVKGWLPIGQLVKGVIPSVGEWLAHQVKGSLDGTLKQETGQWLNKQEKIIRVDKPLNS